MTDQNNIPAPGTGGTSGATRGRARKPLVIAGVVVGALLAGGIATKAFSHGHGWGHGFGHHRGGFMGASLSDPIDPARMDERIERGMKHFAVEADASPEQTKKLADIAKAAARDVLPLREKAQGVRKQLTDLLTQPTIDRAQLEKLRAEQMANAETLTKRMTQALADAGEVLTPDQRKKVADRMEERRGRWFRR